MNARFFVEIEQLQVSMITISDFFPGTLFEPLAGVVFPGLRAISSRITFRSSQVYTVQMHLLI